jgi:hypothetical protein
VHRVAVALHARQKGYVVVTSSACHGRQFWQTTSFGWPHRRRGAPVCV